MKLEPLVDGTPLRHLSTVGWRDEGFRTVHGYWHRMEIGDYAIEYYHGELSIHDGKGMMVLPQVTALEQLRTLVKLLKGEG